MATSTALAKISASSFSLRRDLKQGLSSPQQNVVTPKLKAVRQNETRPRSHMQQAQGQRQMTDLKERLEDITTPLNVPPQRTVQEKPTTSSPSGRPDGAETTQRSRPADEYFVTDRRPIVLFDGVCNMCNSAVNFMLDNDPEGKLRYASLQSDAGKKLLRRAGRATDDYSSMVVVEAKRSYIHSDAVLHVARCLQSPVYKGLGSVGAFVPTFVRDALYKVVAQNRHKIMGTADSCRFLDQEQASRFVS